MSDLIAVPKHKVDRLAENLATAKAEIEALRGRVAELESGLEGIANCAFGYTGCRQTAEEAASWMNGEAMRLLGDPQSKAWLKRKQAEAVGVLANRLQKEADELDMEIDMSDTACTLLIAKSVASNEAQRLRAEADQLEKTDD